jgi:pantetheine-phosphate adenylyltransferase
MMTGESEFYISSRLVKEVVSLGGNVSGLVPANVLKKLSQKFKGGAPTGGAISGGAES